MHVLNDLAERRFRVVHGDVRAAEWRDAGRRECYCAIESTRTLVCSNIQIPWPSCNSQMDINKGLTDREVA